MTNRHTLTEIYISFYGRRSYKSGRRWDKLIQREQILRLNKFLHRILSIKDLKIYNRKGKTYKKAETWRLSGVDIQLSEQLSKTYTEEYDVIYKPIDKYLLKLGHAIYNMWGKAPDVMSWQMDGRHAWKDREEND